MTHRPESKEEMVERLTRQFRELLEKRLPEEPGTLEEIERVTEEIGTEIKREIEDECIDWHGSGYIGPQITCGCGQISKFKKYNPKRIVGLCGETTVTRAYYHCSSCGVGYVPLDAKLGLDSGCASIGVRTKVARLAAWIPFGDVSLELRELCGIHLSRKRCLAHCRISRSTNQGGAFRYMATLERTEAFGERVYALAFDSGVENAHDVACLGDGAAWIWRSFAHHYPNAVGDTGLLPRLRTPGHGSQGVVW